MQPNPSTPGIDFGHIVLFLRRNGFTHARTLFAYSILVNLTILAPSFHMMQVYDRVLSSHSLPTLLAITAIVLFAITLYALGEMVRGRVAQRLAATYAVAVSRKLFARLGDPSASGRASSYIRDFGASRQFLGSRVFIGLFDLPFVPLYLVLLFMVHPTVGIVTLAGILAIAVAGYFNYKLTTQARVSSQNTEGDAGIFAQSVFARSGEVRALGMVPNLLSNWGNRMASSLVAGEEANATSSLLYAVSRGVRQAIQVITMAWCAGLVLEGEMSAGLIFMASMISGRALAPLEQVVGGWETTVKSLESFNSVEQLTGPDKALQKRPDLPAPKGQLSARDLVFRDFSRKPILAAARFDIKPAEAVIVQGEPGSGKSVLMSILAGARNPEGGQVTLDGAPRELWPQAQWGRSIGYCGEEPGLLVGTVAQNIGRFDPDLQLDEVYRLSQALGLHELVASLPQGYQTMLMNAHDQLPASGRKQIALARALYGSPRVILLDQPTTFLDESREGALLNALAEAKRGGAAIALVTRSQMLLRLADRAVQLADGRLQPAELPKRAEVRRVLAADEAGIAPRADQLEPIA